MNRLKKEPGFFESNDKRPDINVGAKYDRSISSPRPRRILAYGIQTRRKVWLHRPS